jgi:hypothetical protein
VWELICHHEYCWGTVTADRSPWHSDGIPSAVAPLPSGQVGLHFSSPQSQIAIPRRSNDPWGYIRALIIEIRARFQGAGTLIDADGSFRIGVDSQGSVIMELLGKTFTLAQVPFGVWHHFTFSHDGLNSIGWGFESWTLPDGTSGGAGGGGKEPGQVQGVGTKGVLIGNRIGAPSQHLTGDIALVKIWRSSPSTISDGFVDRPLTPGVANCWAEFFRKLKEAMRNDPECAYWLVNFVRAFQTGLLAKISQMSGDKIAEFKEMGQQYAELWRAGKIDSPEMQALAKKMRDWLKTEGLVSLDDPDLFAELNNPCLKKLIKFLPSLDCDPQFQALIKAILGIGDGSAKAS